MVDLMEILKRIGRGGHLTMEGELLYLCIFSLLSQPSNFLQCVLPFLHKLKLHKHLIYRAVNTQRLFAPIVHQIRRYNNSMHDCQNCQDTHSVTQLGKRDPVPHLNCLDESHLIQSAVLPLKFNFHDAFFNLSSQWSYVVQILCICWTVPNVRAILSQSKTILKFY